MSEGTPAARPPGRVPPYRNPWVLAFLAGIAMLTLIRPLLRHEPPPPPVLAQVGAFTLQDAGGSRFGSADLEGQVYVVSFFFTRCTSICPALMRGMKGLDERFRREGVRRVHLVSVSVDPVADTPERLREYGDALGVDRSTWTLLTGPPDAVRALVVEGFRLPLGEPTKGDGALIDIAHSGRVVLVDAKGGIRGYYDPDADGLDEAFHRALQVLEEAGHPPR